ncbi:helix-turn-helix domain-containing protein [Sporosarcina saromensis]|uniref:Helix-turn-helix domain-containing protein n=1 Tax=Sporosarcina saromensis TaxID=359365 RepID=A0ABU4G7Z4_9BACL|nr:helix-turn-helix domain-containing protein [Sporosarcina saromensis]MDW0113101.1 helix-turn-helix domain-containing protein [Sporosarcina saromensis]
MITFKALLGKLAPQGIRLAAGVTKVDSTFTYINVQEFPLKSERIRSGGLILTTLASFESIDNIFEHLSWFIARGVRGIGISEILIGQVPEEVIKFCERHEFPLLIIPGPVPYSEVYQAYHGLLLEESNEISRKIEDINLSLMNVVALEIPYEKSIALLINTMGKYMKAPIVYVNQLFGIEGVWGKREMDPELIVQAAVSEFQYAELETDSLASIPFQVDYAEMTHEFIAYPIINGQESYGYLLIGMKERFNLLEHSIIKHGKTALLLVAVKNKTMDKYLKNEKIIMLETILNNSKQTDNKVELLPALQKESQIHILATEQREKLGAVFEDVHRLLNSIDPHPLVWLYEQKIIYLAFEPIPSTLINKIIRKHVQLLWGQSEWSINDTSEDIAKKYNQALISVRHGMKRGFQVISWEDVGIDGLLRRLADDEIGKERAESLLQPLIEYDQQENSELLKTLKVYLSSFLNLKESAEKLFIHRNTVKYRIKKIEELYGGISFDDTDTFLYFLMAVKVYEMI